MQTFSSDSEVQPQLRATAQHGELCECKDHVPQLGIHENTAQSTPDVEWVLSKCLSEWVDARTEMDRSNNMDGGDLRNNYRPFLFHLALKWIEAPR